MTIRTRRRAVGLDGPKPAEVPPVRYTFSLAFVALLLANVTLPAQTPDPAALRKRLTELDDKIAALQRESAELRKQLDQLAPPKPVVLTPAEAVAAFAKNPDQPVTVEFGVEAGSAADRTGPGPADVIVATWDGLLTDGGRFTVVLHPKAYAGLELPPKEKGKPATKPAPGKERETIGRHIDEHGLRATGVVKRTGIHDYLIEVDDPAKVTLFISIAPKPLRR